MKSSLAKMASLLKLFIMSFMVTSIIAASIFDHNFERNTPAICTKGGRVCLPGETIKCENDNVTGESGGCECFFILTCHPERVNCTYYSSADAEGVPCSS